jgi:hypothetical protein
MAVQLTRAGEEVSNLILIDPFFNVPKALADLDLRGGDLGLDLIYERHHSASADLKRLSHRANESLSFKATQPDSERTVRGGRRPTIALVPVRMAFDASLGPAAFSTVPLPGQTHMTNP